MGSKDIDASSSSLTCIPKSAKPRKSSLVRKFRALLGCPQSSDPSPLGHPPSRPPSSMEDIASTHPLPLDSDSVQNKPSPRRVYKYDAFLSFRGTDTRNNFTDHLYNHLIRKGIFAFMDDKRLEQGEPISSQLRQAITYSRVSIVVFSRDYASSKWCLEEMATIADCKDEWEQTVFPIFYDVDPSHVRNQTGSYADAFVLHTTKEGALKIERWKKAMRGLANSVGWDVRDKPEFTQIEAIVQKVIKTLDHKFSGFDDDLIGIQPRVEKMEELLKLSSRNDDFRVLGICGMGGIGKTTHAKVLYDKISYQFDASCYIENVSQNYRDGGAIIIQKQILHQTVDEKNLEMYSHFEISSIVRNRLSCIKVLIVLDNVDKLEQLEELAISPKLLGSGSRIIIITRDEHILKVYGADEVHQVPLLNEDDARELFLRKAFKSDSPSSSSCMELTPKILEYAQSLPLAIKTVGSLLYSRDATQWRDALDRMRKNPNKNIMDVLQISFEGLESDEKEIFLHIACFFHGEREEYVKHILDSCGLHPHIGLPIILEKSLITTRNQEIHMHEMLQELGKKIVREKSPEEPGSWSRLWLYQDFHRVMMSATGTYNVKAIVLEQKEDVSKYSQLRIEGLSKMTGLKLLILYHNNFSGSLNYLPDNLQYLLWDRYPFSSLPSSFDPYSLVELKLPNSSIKRLWESPKNFPCLKKMDLSSSKDLIKTPNFEWIPNLNWLDLSGCTNLSQVHPSIGLLTELTYLSLRNCSNLVSINLGTECKLRSLTVLHLSGCTKLENTPDFTGLSNLVYLDLEQCTSLFTVHESIGDLVMLKFPSLRGCISLVEMPTSVNNMTCLQTLDLHGCFELMNLPLLPLQRVMYSSYLKSLIFLDLGSCKLRRIPIAIGELKYLERLNLQRSRIHDLPHTIERLSSLAYLNLADCYELGLMPELPFDNASSVGRYFTTVSTSRNHRSGLYIFNCNTVMNFYWMLVALSWLARLVMQPCHFRCGFDIIIPISRSEIPKWYFNHQFEGGSMIRIVDCDVNNNWLGFAFCVAFEVNKNRPAISSSSSQMPSPLYLSFESENTEESFDSPPCLDMDKEHVGPISEYCWIIYISQAHCHFVKTGAHIKFKARPDFEIKKWGLRMVFKQDVNMMRTELQSMRNQSDDPSFHNYIDESSGPKIQLPSYRLVTLDVYENENFSNTGPKIQLPYNWLVTEEDEKENMDAKAKDNLYNLGHSIGEQEDENMKAKGKQSNLSNMDLKIGQPS